MQVKMTVNEAAQDHDVEPRTLLVQYLRESCGLTGTKVGCDTSSCGACTVLREGEWHPVQTAFHEHHGLQCGYCTAGMVMAAVSLLEEIPNPSERDVRLGLEGNLCRCTGYHNIVESVLAAADEMKTRS